jgi:hypothetical protein
LGQAAGREDVAPPAKAPVDAPLARGPWRPNRQPARGNQQAQQTATRGNAEKLPPVFNPFLRTVHNKRSNNTKHKFLRERKNGYSRIVHY